MERSPLFWPSAVLLLGIVGYTGAAVIPAIIPQAVPTANKRGSAGTVFALASNNTAGTAGQVACDDGTGLLTYSGCATNAVTSTTPVTVNTNTTGDQNLMELSLSAGFLNSLGKPFDIFGAGVYTTQTGQTPTLDFKVKLCTVSGCGSGTVVTLASITSGATTGASSNISWNLRLVAVTAATGATGNLEVHGPARIDLGSALATAATVYNDTNTAVSSNIDLTAALFVDFTVAFSTNAAGANTCTQREGVVNPGGSTAGGGGGGGAGTLSGPIASLPAAGTVGRTFLPTDSGIYDILYDDGTAWEYFIGGLQMLFSPNTTVTNLNFGSTLTATSLGTGAGVKLVSTGSTGFNSRGIFVPKLNALFTFTVAFYCNAAVTASSNTGCNLGLTNGLTAGSAIKIIGYVCCAAARLTQTVWTVNGSFTADNFNGNVPLQTAQKLIWLRVKEDVSNRCQYHSVNGVDWVVDFCEAVGANFTTTDYGVIIWDGNNNVQAVNDIVYWKETTP